MSGAAAVKPMASEKSGVIGLPGPIAYANRVGRVLVAPSGPNPIGMHIGRAIIGMTAEEADSLALALAKAAADCRRVL